MRKLISLILAGGILGAAIFVAPAPASGEAWSLVTFPGAPVGHVSASAEGSRVYAVSAGELRRSGDGGETWSVIMPGTAAAKAVAVSSQNPDDLIVATGRGMHRSSDGGAHWMVGGGHLTTASFAAVARSQSDPQVAWALTVSLSTHSLIKTTDGGATWTLVPTLRPRQSSTLAIDPKDPQTVYVGAFQVLYKTVDDGLTWSSLSPDLSHIYSIAIDPVNPDHIYLSGVRRVLVSANGGLSFIDAGRGYYDDPERPKLPGVVAVGAGSLYLAGNEDIGWEAEGIWQKSEGEWEQIPGLEVQVYWIAASSGAVFAATEEGLYRLGTARAGPPDPDTYPVVVIPGIMGSWRDHGVWRLDPILHTYDPLISALSAAGYREGVDLFTFPYEWRTSNDYTASLLRERIGQIKTQTGQDKVNIAAHSMGGLVARAYIQGPGYQGDVNKLILIGTPHLGAPVAYLAWEGADLSYMGDVRAFVVEQAFRVEAAREGYFRLYDYIHDRVRSLGELLPVYDYLRDVGEPMRSYPNRYPRNQFLEGIDANRSVLAARGIEVYSIAGNLGPASTGGLLRLVESPNSLWPDGYPENHEEILFGDRGIENTNGDRTVPLTSASRLGNITEFPGKHSDIVTLGQNRVLEILGRDPLNELRRTRGFTRFWLLFVHSPVEISVWQGGRQISADFYTGSGEEPQVMSLPDPENGEYEIQAVGVGSGSYRIDLALLDAETGEGEVKASLSDTTEPGELDRFTVRMSSTDIHLEDDSTPSVSGGSDGGIGGSGPEGFLLAALENRRSAESREESLIPDPARRPSRPGWAGVIVAVLVAGVLAYALGSIVRSARR